MFKSLSKWWSSLFEVKDFNVRTLNLDIKSEQLKKVKNAARFIH